VESLGTLQLIALQPLFLNNSKARLRTVADFGETDAISNAVG